MFNVFLCNKLPRPLLELAGTFTAQMLTSKVMKDFAELSNINVSENRLRQYDELCLCKLIFTEMKWKQLMPRKIKIQSTNIMWKTMNSDVSLWSDCDATHRFEVFEIPAQWYKILKISFKMPSWNVSHWCFHSLTVCTLSFSSRWNSDRHKPDWVWHKVSSRLSSLYLFFCLSFHVQLLPLLWDLTGWFMALPITLKEERVFPPPAEALTVMDSSPESQP